MLSNTIVRTSRLFVLVLLAACGSSSDAMAPSSSAGRSRAPAAGYRLAETDSPYLRAHANDPVAWHAWGEAAFAEAHARDVPVFLSLGYSSCHWCHVMQHESFQDEAVAAYLNEHFVCIKVDREQHPDVDARYMDAVVALTGRGGWPLTVFCTAEGQPFLGGTYFPPTARYGMPSFTEVLEHVVGLWTNERESVDDAARGLGAALTTDTLPAAGDAFEAAPLLASAGARLASRLDPADGGWRSATQKFPPSLALSFLLRCASRGLAVDLAPIETTLDVMASRGLRDVIGGGFHRYCVDARWLLPHFEKMLSDNALLAQAYAEAFAVTGHTRHADVARDTLAWVRRDLRLEGGLFASARDADSRPFDKYGTALPGSHPEEGLAYVWTGERLAAVLGAGDGARAARLLGVTDEGTFERGMSVARTMRTLDEIAASPGIDGVPAGDAFFVWWADVRARLLADRDRRPQATRDDKALAAWNGLLLSAFARAGRLLDDAELRSEASLLGHALLAQLVAPDGSVQHQVFEGRASGDGNLTDHAAVARGLLDAYEATGETDMLLSALRITDVAFGRFHDDEGGGFFETDGRDPLLPGRARQVEDGVVPAGQSLLLEVLCRLTPLDDTGRSAETVERSLRRLAGWIEESPSSFPAALVALDAAAGPLAEVVLDGTPDDAGYAELLAEARRAWLPASLFVPSARAAAAALRGGALGQEPSLLAGRRAEHGGVAWLCTHGVCLLPITSVDDLAGAWDGLRTR